EEDLHPRAAERNRARRRRRGAAPPRGGRPDDHPGADRRGSAQGSPVVRRFDERTGREGRGGDAASPRRGRCASRGDQVRRTMRLEKATGLALCLAAGALVAAAPARADGAKLKVKTSLGAFATVAKAVGGDAIEVEALARPTEDPHEITATPELIMRLKDAD